MTPPPHPILVDSIVAESHYCHERETAVGIVPHLRQRLETKKWIGSLSRERGHHVYRQYDERMVETRAIAHWSLYSTVEPHYVVVRSLRTVIASRSHAIVLT